MAVFGMPGGAEWWIIFIVILLLLGPALLLGGLVWLIAGRKPRAVGSARADAPAGGQEVGDHAAPIGVLSSGAKLAGRAVYYTGGVFTLEGQGPVGQQFVRMHHARGQIHWSTPQIRSWADAHFGEPDASPR